MCSPLFQNTYITALTSNWWNSSGSILRSCCMVIILNLAQTKFSTSFLDRLINFSGTVGKLVYLNKLYVKWLCLFYLTALWG